MHLYQVVKATWGYHGAPRNQRCFAVVGSQAGQSHTMDNVPPQSTDEEDDVVGLRRRHFNGRRRGDVSGKDAPLHVAGDPAVDTGAGAAAGAGAGAGAGDGKQDDAQVSEGGGSVDAHDVWGGKEGEKTFDGQTIGMDLGTTNSCELAALVLCADVAVRWGVTRGCWCICRRRILVQ